MNWFNKLFEKYNMDWLEIQRRKDSVWITTGWREWRSTINHRLEEIEDLEKTVTEQVEWQYKHNVNQN